MEFKECVKERLTLTLKSGLLCAAMLMPATVLAQSLETVRGEETNSPTNAMTVATITTEQRGVNLIPADTATAAVSAQRRKIASLSGHIQSRYQIPDHKAQQIVAAAIRSGETHQVEPELILAIIAVESMFRERAVSRVGARGLMQVMPGSHSGKVRQIGLLNRDEAQTQRLADAEQHQRNPEQQLEQQSRRCDQPFQQADQQDQYEGG